MSYKPLSFDDKAKEEKQKVELDRIALNQILDESIEDGVGLLKKLFPHGYSKYSDTALVFALFWKRADLLILERKHALENPAGEEEK